jgi:purine catabolism regulator
MKPSPQVSLGELIRLAFPPGGGRSTAAMREQAVHWVLMAGAGVVPQAGDFLLCGNAPTKKELSAWGELGIAGAAFPAGTALPNNAAFPIIILPEGASLRAIQQSALELIVNRQSYLAERGAHISQTLARQSLEDTGLPGLTQAMYDLGGQTVLVQDKRLTPLAHTVAPALAARWPELLDLLSAPNRLPENLRDRRQGATMGVWRDPSLPDGLARLVAPLVSKGMARGYLSIVGLNDELDVLDQLVAEYGAAACALEMAKAKAVSDIEKRARGDFVDAVLTGSVSLDELQRWAKRIDYNVDKPHAALVWRWGEGGQLPSLRRLETIVNQSVAQPGVTALVRLRDTEVVVFCAVQEGDRPETALMVASMIAQAAAAEYPGQRLYGGIGRAADELSEWRDSYREAAQALSMAMRLRENRPLYFGDLSVYRLLFQLENHPELEAFCREALGPLLDYEGGGDLLETLEAFCEKLGNLSQTAEKLYIHRNSLLYRMERIEQVAHLDLDNPDMRLAVHLALKVRKMLLPPSERKIG